jgi:hypothetical protein
MAKNMKLAYIVSAYKSPKNLIRLIDRLNTRGSNFVIHVDKNSPRETFEEMQSSLKNFDNVHFMKRHKSPYRGFGHVKTTLKGLEYLRQNNINYDYLFVTTGQDYPIKSNDYINSFLNINYGKSFIEYFLMPTNNWENGGMDRIKYYYIHSKRGSRKISRSKIPWVEKNIPNNIRPWGGSGYFTLHRKHADYILKFIKDNPDYVRFFKHTDIPDEIFFQTILLNSKHKNKLICDDIRFIDWSNPDECPKVLKETDFEKLKNSKDLIGRKFDIKTDSKVLDRIDKEILYV